MGERHSRRSALLHLVAVALLFLGYGVELLGKLLDLMTPQPSPITETPMASVPREEIIGGTLRFSWNVIAPPRQETTPI